MTESMLKSLRCACGASWTCSDGVLKYNPADKPEPVAWVDSLNRARPECVTDFKYLSVAQVQRGEQHNYIPLYTAPPPHTLWRKRQIAEQEERDA